MTYIVEYTREDRCYFDILTEEDKAEHTHKEAFDNMERALGFCQGIETMYGTILKKTYLTPATVSRKGKGRRYGTA